MKTKHYILVGLFLAVCVMLLTIGVISGERQSAEIARIQRIEKQLDRLAEYMGYESMGVIDIYEVSKRNGSIYDGPAINRQLYEQIGAEYTENDCDFYFGELEDDVMIFKKVVYEGEKKEPIFEQKIVKVYLYAQI